MAGGIGDIEVPTDARGRMALYDSGHEPERYVSAAAVIKGTVKKESNPSDPNAGAAV